MTTFETFETQQTEEQIEEALLKIRVALEEKASGIAEHWKKFADGDEPEFLAYFMPGHEVHGLMHAHFLEQIAASEELPSQGRQAVIKTGRAVLWAYSNTDENGEPFDVTYVGERVEPVQ